MSQNINQTDWVAPVTVLGHIKVRHYDFFFFYFHSDSLFIKHNQIQFLLCLEK